MSGQRSDSDLSDTLFNLVLGAFGFLLGGAMAFHLAVKSAAVLVGRHPAITLNDTVDAVKASPANPVAGYVQAEMPPAPLVWLLLGLFLMLPAGLFLWWVTRRKTPAHPDGMASPVELRSVLSRKAATAAAQLSVQQTGAPPNPQPPLMYLGAHRSGSLWAQAEDSVLGVAPPRSGKTLWFGVGQILDSPGAVIATSTKAEVVRLTADLRGSNGRPVYVFDPEGISNWPTQLRWSPVDGCADPAIAAERSRAFVSAVPLGQSAKNADFFTQGADTVLRCLLHAAALGGKSMADVARWAAEFKNNEPLDILGQAEGAAPGWQGNLRTFTRGADDTVSSTKMTLGLILKPLASPSVMRAVTPPPGTGLNVGEFLESGGTLYLLSEGDDDSTAPFITALADHIVKVAKRTSQQQPGGRLDPPLTLVLDEAANVAPLPNLPGLMSDSGGRGITTIVLLQSFSQGRRRWGSEGFSALWGSATVKLILGGLSEADDLEELSKLCGDRRIRRTSTTHGRQAGSVTESEERERVLPTEKIRTLPRGTALLFYRNLRPTLVSLRPWWKRSDAAAIADAERAASAGSTLAAVTVDA